MQTVMPPARRERAALQVLRCPRSGPTTSCMSRWTRWARRSSSSPGGVGQRALAAVQQAPAQLVLQQLDLAADRRLRDVQPLGRPGEAALLGHGPEHLQLAHVHLMTSLRWHSDHAGRSYARKRMKYTTSLSFTHKGRPRLRPVEDSRRWERAAASGARTRHAAACTTPARCATPAASASWPTGRARAAARCCRWRSRRSRAWRIAARSTRTAAPATAPACRRDPLGLLAPDLSRSCRTHAAAARGRPWCSCRAERGPPRGRAALVEEALEATGCPSLGWREVPVREDALGEKARRSRPAIAQCRAPAGGDAPRRFAARAAHRVERRATAAAGCHDLYVASLSHRTIVYKALVRAAGPRRLLPRPAAARLPHARSRSSTSASAPTRCPRWAMTQPFRHARATTARSTPSTATGPGCARARARLAGGSGAARRAAPLVPTGRRATRPASTRRWRC